jgi:hypothetical protein
VAQSKVLLLANGRTRFEKGRKGYLTTSCSKRNLDGGCADWTDWSEFVNLGPDVYIVKWLFYILWAVSVNLECIMRVHKRADVYSEQKTTFATLCAYLVKTLAPYAAGSGISEIKCIIGILKKKRKKKKEKEKSKDGRINLSLKQQLDL